MSTMPNMPARLTNPLGIILVVMLLLVIRVQAALRWRTLSALSALMPCPASPNRCACSNAQSSAEPANRAANSAIAKGVGWGSLKRGLMFQAAYGWKMSCVGLCFRLPYLWSGLMFV
ncbi:hypothetical protein [Kingella oralis]|jgi:hypothetical protein|uniref:hypothetical protein n=1 Tax=Kingella oralis TaxID=505 RepID=UPI002D7E3305|nr:hypothetical protein [Kingella oralis]